MAGDIDEEEDRPFVDKEDDAHGDSYSSADSDAEEETRKGAKRDREQLDQDEVEALKKDLGDDARVGKRVKAASQLITEGDGMLSQGEAPSKESEEVWKSLQDHKVEATTLPNDGSKEEMVLVKKQYRFAGEEVKEEKLLPASHPEAIAYLANLKKEASPSIAITVEGTKVAPSSIPVKATVGPRKKKSSLAAMSAAATGKPVKINTLEKSKMDWNKFKDQTVDEREREEIEAQTNGGSSGLSSMKGYMERKSFLDRVQDRLGEQR